MTGMIGRRGALALGGAALLGKGAAGQGAWNPDRPLRMLVGFPAGGVTDVIARVAAEGMAARLGQPVIVDNRAGAGGNIAAAQAARAAPDGHTLLLATNNSHGANPALYQNIGFDPVRDFTPVALLASITNVLVVHPSLPARNVAELVELAKARPGRMNFASAAVGAAGHLVGEMFKTRTGTDIVHVPFRGAAPAQTEVVAGRVEMLFGTLQTVLEPVRAGQLRALAVTSLARVPQLPEVPTLAETVIPGFSADAWFALFGPAGMGEGVTARLNAAARDALADPALRARLTDQGFAVHVGTPAELRAFVPAEIEKWGEAVRISGARGE
ncbi:tripartite tricarboxylate transporter substrate binding protein [Falsiroseomonas sp. CW058]|uniref:tripartite tricarboxylate transporter substrate binding protein n=1 Tax=Falsiroseomonas sp. CW058 TaxID=3388664 RepID=UPI003D31A485